MKYSKILGVGSVLLTATLAFACSDEFGGVEGESSGGDGSGAEGGAVDQSGSATQAGHGGTKGGTPGASGSATTAGAGGTAGASGGTAGDAGSGGVAASGGVAGTATAGGDAGTAGTGDEPDCPKNSCCLSSGVVERDAVSPDNACLSCQPFRSNSDWSDRNGELCRTKTAEPFFPGRVKRLNKSCGEGGCGDVTEYEPTVDQMLTMAATQPVDALLLDFANLRASTFLGVSKAEVRFQLKAVTTGQSYRVTASGAASPLCQHLFGTKEYTEIKCDATAAVKAWMTAPASAERTLTISPVVNGSPLIVQTNKSSVAAERPALLLDYTASCEGDRCVSIEKTE